jgi:hypothetical protein
VIFSIQGKNFFGSRAGAQRNRLDGQIVDAAMVVIVVMVVAMIMLMCHGVMIVVWS